MPPTKGQGWDTGLWGMAKISIADAPVDAKIIGWLSACKILKLKKEAHKVAKNAPIIDTYTSFLGIIFIGTGVI